MECHTHSHFSSRYLQVTLGLRPRAVTWHPHPTPDTSPPLSPPHPSGSLVSDSWTSTTFKMGGLTPLWTVCQRGNFNLSTCLWAYIWAISISLQSLLQPISTLPTCPHNLGHINSTILCKKALLSRTLRFPCLATRTQDCKQFHRSQPSIFTEQ